MSSRRRIGLRWGLRWSSRADNTFLAPAVDHVSIIGARNEALLPSPCCPLEPYPAVDDLGIRGIVADSSLPRLKRVFLGGSASREPIQRR